MAFTVNDPSDLEQLIVEHPEWGAELRRLLGNDDSRALPAILREVAEVQRELAESQRRSEQVARLRCWTTRAVGVKVDSASGLRGTSPGGT
jgi:hypothetical protein